MISAIEIMREVLRNPDAKPIKAHRSTQGDSSFCKRHVHRKKNPLSRSYCDECLDYFRNKRPNKNERQGRPLIPRGAR